MQKLMNTSLMNRSPMASNATVERRTQPGFANDSADSSLTARTGGTSSFVNHHTMSNSTAEQQRRVAVNNNSPDSFSGRLGNGTTFANRSLGANPGFREQTRAMFTNHWRGAAFVGGQYAAFRNYQPQWHDSDWWWHHCERIVFVTVFAQPFPFFFDAGYWYPAWGYYPDSYYPYDGPIFGYNDLLPDQVITNVQIELQNEGYYDGPIDGVLSQGTRAAIADYQYEHGLAVTAAIDEPTVASLGLI